MPDSFNIGGPGLVSLIHAAQMLNKEEFEVRFFGQTGKDETAERIFELLQKTPLEITNYQVNSNLPTPFTDVFSDPDFDNGHGERNEVIIHYMGEKKMAAFNQYIQTERGKAFVSQFLKNGERIKIINGDGKVSHSDFAGNGEGNMAHATLRFAALSSLNKDVIGRAFAFHKNSNGVRGRELIRTTDPIVPSDIDKLKNGSFELLIGLNSELDRTEDQWAETLGHESFLHSTNQANVIQEVLHQLKSGNSNTDDLIKMLQRQSSNAKNEDENKNSNKKFLEYLDQLQKNIEKGKKEL